MIAGRMCLTLGGNHLQHGHQIIDTVVTDLFHETEDSSTEEDLGVAILENNRFQSFSFQSGDNFQERESHLELVSNQVNLVHHSVRCCNVLLLLCDRPFHLFHCSHGLLGAKNDIAGPEVSVENPE